MNLSIKNLYNKLLNISNQFIVNEEEVEVPQEQSMLNIIEEARKEWLDAKKVFEEVSDPDLVDHLIYQMEASQKKYMYLLKKAKQDNVYNEDIKKTIEGYF